MEQGLNHAELLNMVEQGVCAALTEKDQEETQKDRENEDLKNQIREMRALLDSMNVANTAQQLNNQSPQDNVQPMMQQGQYPFYPQHPHVQFNPMQYYGNNTGRGNVRGDNRYRGNNRGRGRGGRGNQSELKYCWTHGLCIHNGKECKNPMQGHQSDATLENRMGGNTRNIKS